MWRALPLSLRVSVSQALRDVRGPGWYTYAPSTTEPAMFRSELELFGALRVDELKIVIKAINAQRYALDFKRLNVSGSKSMLCRRIWSVLCMLALRTHRASASGQDDSASIAAAAGAAGMASREMRESGSGAVVAASSASSAPGSSAPGSSASASSASASAASASSSSASSASASSSSASAHAPSKTPEMRHVSVPEDWNVPRIIPGTNVLAIVPPIAIQQPYGLSNGGFGNIAPSFFPQHTFVIFPPPPYHTIPEASPFEEEHIRQLQEDGCYTNPLRDLLYALRYKKHDVQATMLFLQSRMSPAEIDAIEERQINRRLAMSEVDEKNTKQKREDERKRLWREGEIRNALDGEYADSQLLSDDVVGKFLDELPSVPERSSSCSDSAGDSSSLPSMPAAAISQAPLSWRQAVREPMVRTIELECKAYTWFPGASREFFRATVLPQIRKFVLDSNQGCDDVHERTVCTPVEGSRDACVPSSAVGVGAPPRTNPPRHQFVAYMEKLVNDLETSLYMSMGGMPPLFRPAQRILNEKHKRELADEGIEILN
eukprot:g2120.t1